MTSNSTSGYATVTILYRSWDFDPRVAGRRAVRSHRDALRRLGEEQA